MNYLLRRAAFLIILTAAVFTFAQDKTGKQESFGKIAKLSQSKKPDDLKKGYELGKTYLKQYGTDNDDNAQKIKKFVDGYRSALFNKALDEHRLNDAAAFGKEMLAENPNDVYVKMNLAYAGYELFTKKNDKNFAGYAQIEISKYNYDAFTKNKDKTYAADSIDYAKQTLAAFDAGNVPATFAPFKTKDEAAALMHYTIAVLTDDTNSKDAAAEYFKALQFDSQIKTTSFPYYAIALYYESAYQKAAGDYQTKFGARTSEDAEMKAAQENLMKITDRMLDAYVRTVKVSDGEPDNPTKGGFKTRLKDVYKFRFQKDDGLDEFSQKTLAMPFPDPNIL